MERSILLNEILRKLKEISDNTDSIRYGIAGSISRGKESKKSDIDIVVDTGNLSIEDILDIKEEFSYFNRKVDVIQLPLLKKEDEEMEELCKSSGLPVNSDSVYKSIVKDVIWVDQELN